MAKQASVVDAEELLAEDQEIDQNLRPKTLAQFVGQDKVKESIKVFIEAAKKRQEAIDHVLIYGPAGLGKTTLSHIIAHEMGVNIRTTSGPAIERAGDLASILTNLADGDVLFIDEIHRLAKVIEEMLYPAMEEYALDLVLGKGPSAKTLRLDLPHFTLIGATTRIGLLSSPMRDRFGLIHQLDFYQTKDIEKIITRACRILKIPIQKEAITEIARRSRFTPRVANRLIKRVRDFAQVRHDGIITAKIADEALDLMDVDQHGLDRSDRRILETIIEKFSGGPVGVETLAAATHEEAATISDVYEPYLMQIGFLERTAKGRKVTARGLKYLGAAKASQGALL